MHIKDWDFRWQHVYRHESPIPLPKGTRLSMEYTYDNSAANAAQSRAAAGARVLGPALEATRWATSGSSCWPRTTPIAARLTAEINAKMTAEDIVGYETMLKVTPNDAELHDDVALLYLGMGMAANAVRHFEAVGGAQARLGAGAVQSRHRARAGGPPRSIGRLHSAPR